MRKTDFLIVGIICLILGFIVFWHGYSIMQEYSGPWGQMARQYSTEAQRRYDQAQIEATSGGVLAIVGFASLVYGSILKEEPRDAKPELGGLMGYIERGRKKRKGIEVSTIKYCSFCGIKNEKDAVYCKKCGKKIS